VAFATPPMSRNPRLGGGSHIDGIVSTGNELG
jgi:hypothetical protein